MEDVKILERLMDWLIMVTEGQATIADYKSLLNEEFDYQKYYLKRTIERSQELKMKSTLSY